MGSLKLLSSSLVRSGVRLKMWSTESIKEMLKKPAGLHTNVLVGEKGAKFNVGLVFTASSCSTVNSLQGCGRHAFLVSAFSRFLL